jgi:MtN3 and saliva related transmembrane protein
LAISSWVGSFAAIASTASFAPQAWQIIRSRKTRDISTGMYVLTVGGFALWMTYGVTIRAWPLIAANSICLVLSAFILGMKLLPPRKKEEIAKALDPTT